MRETPWCVIDLNTDTGQIFVQERWLYHWRTRPPLLPWTVHEQRDFHNRADRAIWAVWSNRARLEARGNTALARRLAASGCRVNFDIRRVRRDPHWTVTVTKIPAGEFATSSVLWNARTIRLDSNDTRTKRRCRDVPRVCHSQIPVAHEFGHAAGNTSVLGRGDEYRAGHGQRRDRASIMNIGTQLRDRHLQTLIDELNLMSPGTTFSVARIR